MKPILTITVNPALDLSTEAPAVIPDRKLRCSTLVVHPGGGGVNASRAISNLGGSSKTLIALGGPTGDRVKHLLEAAGLSVHSLGVDHGTRESMSVKDQATGLQYRFMMPGPEWSQQDCDAARDAIVASVTDGAIVIPSGSMPPGLPPEFFLDLVPAISERGGRVILDTSGDALTRAANSKSGLMVLRMDLVEAEELSGQKLSKIEDVAALTRELYEAQAAEIVMIAADAQGTVIACKDWLGLTRPPFVVPNSKIGGGDSFIGAFAYAMAQDKDPVEACCWGTAAAASAVTQPGTDLCLREETERYVAQVGRQSLS